MGGVVVAHQPPDAGIVGGRKLGDRGVERPEHELVVHAQTHEQPHGDVDHPAVAHDHQGGTGVLLDHLIERLAGSIGEGGQALPSRRQRQVGVEIAGPLEQRAELLVAHAVGFAGAPLHQVGVGVDFQSSQRGRHQLRGLNRPGQRAGPQGIHLGLVALRPALPQHLGLSATQRRQAGTGQIATDDLLDRHF